MAGANQPMAGVNQPIAGLGYVSAKEVHYCGHRRHVKGQGHGEKLFEFQNAIRTFNSRLKLQQPFETSTAV
jgi:hypothetical protein